MFLEGESPTLKEDTIVEVMELICKENPYLYQDQRYTTYASTFTLIMATHFQGIHEEIF